MKTAKGTIFMLAALATVTFVAQDAAPPLSVQLDGKTFEVTLMDDAGTNNGPDTLVFRDGRFDSTACHPYGFGAAAYTAKSVESGVAFSAETHSEDGGRIQWAGTISEDRIEGTMVWTDAEGNVTKNKFKGKARA